MQETGRGGLTRFLSQEFFCADPEADNFPSMTEGVMDGKDGARYPLFLAKLAMKSTSLTTPSVGKAL